MLVKRFKFLFHTSQKFSQIAALNNQFIFKSTYQFSFPPILFESNNFGGASDSSDLETDTSSEEEEHYKIPKKEALSDEEGSSFSSWSSSESGSESGEEDEKS